MTFDTRKKKKKKKKKKFIFVIVKALWKIKEYLSLVIRTNFKGWHKASDVCMYVFTQPLWSIFKQTTAGLRSEFFFDKIDCYTKTKESSLPKSSNNYTITIRL